MYVTHSHALAGDTCSYLCVYCDKPQCFHVPSISPVFISLTLAAIGFPFRRCLLSRRCYLPFVTCNKTFSFFFFFLNGYVLPLLLCRSLQSRWSLFHHCCLHFFCMHWFSPASVMFFIIFQYSKYWIHFLSQPDKDTICHSPWWILKLKLAGINWRWCTKVCT